MAAAARISRWRAALAPMSSGRRRHFTSGLRRSTPRFVQGASTSTASARGAYELTNSCAVPSIVCTIVTPIRALASVTR